MSDDIEFKSGNQFWDEARKDLGYGIPAYYITSQPIHGETTWYGPIQSAAVAREVFDRTYPEFDGASVTIEKVESSNPLITPEQLRVNAFREFDEINVDPETQRWGKIFDKSRTTVAWDEWQSSWAHGEVDWHHKGKRYDLEFDYQVQVELSVASDRWSIKAYDVLVKSPADRKTLERTAPELVAARDEAVVELKREKLADEINQRIKKHTLRR